MVARMWREVKARGMPPVFLAGVCALLSVRMWGYAWILGKKKAKQQLGPV